MVSKSVGSRLRIAGGQYLSHLVFGFLSTPLIPIQLRPFLLRCVGIKIGIKAHVGPGMTVNRRNIDIGDFFVAGYGVYLDGGGELRIGNRVHIGPHSKILTVTHSIMPNVYRRDRDEVILCTTRIGDGVWLGVGTTILPGVEIGEGCVVGAGSLVARSCAPNGLYVGVPARRIKELPLADR
jgi:maltose O-acetyltransferase